MGSRGFKRVKHGLMNGVMGCKGAKMIQVESNGDQEVLGYQEKF